MKKFILKKAVCLVTVICVVLSATSVSVFSNAASALSAINSATATTLAGVITTQLGNNEDLGINKTIYTNLSSVSKTYLASELYKLKPSGGFKEISAFATAYETSLRKVVTVINQPMTGDIILSTANSELHFNGAGTDQQAKGLLTRFDRTGDINVESKYILSVTYNLALDISSPNCTADDNTQNWDFYLASGGWQEFRATYATLGGIVSDTSKKLLSTSYQAQENNSFDITTGYKSLVDTLGTASSFSIRTDVSQYPAVFYNENNNENNYLTYVIDKYAIGDALNKASATAIENIILKNGYAFGLDVGTYKNLTSRSKLNTTLANLSSVSAAAMTNSMNSLIGGMVTVASSGESYLYTENSTGQNLPASFAAMGVGGVSTQKKSSVKTVFVFDTRNILKDYIASVKFTATRSSAGKPNGTVATLSLFGADSSSANANPQSSMFYLDFSQMHGKYSSINTGIPYYADITDFVKTQSDKVYIGISGIEDDSIESNPTLVIKYEIAAVLAAFRVSDIAKTKSIITNYGAMLGLTSDQLTLSNISKAALALAGKTVDNTSAFKQMFADAILNVGAFDALKAINAAQNISDFELIVAEFGDVMGITTSLLTNLNDVSRGEVLNKLFNDGADYISGDAFKESFNTEIVNAYLPILSGFQGVDVNDTKLFLQQHGTELGISADDLISNLDFLAIAFTSGKPITDILEFTEIYNDYVNVAGSNVLYILNSTNSVDEFDTIINDYKEYLGIDLTLYNMLEDKNGIYLSLKGVYSEKTAFNTAFNSVINNYLSTPVVTYAKNELFVHFEDKFKNTVFDLATLVWMSTRDFGTHLVKYDISQMNVNPDKLASVKIKFKMGNDNNNNNLSNKSFQLYSVGLGWPLEADNNYYNVNAAGVFNNQELVGEKLEPTLGIGSYVTIDITDYMRRKIKEGRLGEYNFQLASKTTDDSVKMERMAGSTTFAPMEFTFVEDNGEIVNYSPTNASKNIPRNSIVTATFSRPIDSSTVSKNVIVTKNGTVISDYTAVAGSNDNSITITFPNQLDYDSLYTVKLTPGIKFKNDLKSYAFNTVSFTTEKIPFQFLGTTITNEGKVINSLIQKTTPNITVTSSLVNNSVEIPQRVIMVTGLYAVNGEIETMIDSKSIVDILGVGKKTEIKASFVVPEQQGTDYYVACYIWDGFGEMKKLFSDKVQ